MPSTEDWVFETETELDASSLDIEPMGTVESTVEESREEIKEESFFGAPPGFETAETMMEEAQPAEEASAAPSFEVTTPEDVDAEPEAAAPEPEAAIPEPEVPPAPAAPATPKAAFPFGHQSPEEKARRLARVLVSDMIMYNPERHERALAAGTLKEDFDDEIRKSWKEYVDQVGEEIATRTTYWPEALNDVLAKGQQIF